MASARQTTRRVQRQNTLPLQPDRQPGLRQAHRTGQKKHEASPGGDASPTTMELHRRLPALDEETNSRAFLVIDSDIDKRRNTDDIDTLLAQICASDSNGLNGLIGCASAN